MSKKITSLILCIVILITALCACNTESEKTFFAMDTVNTISLPEGKSSELNYLVNYITDLSKDLSAYEKDGALYKLNNNKYLEVDYYSDVYYAIEEAVFCSKASIGYFNTAIGAVTSLWDFEKEILPGKKALKNALETVNLENIVFLDNAIKLKNNVKIDLGGIAKGFALDRAVEYLTNKKISEAYLNFGGSVCYLSKENKTIGIKKPFTENEIVAEISVKNKIVATAGGYERYFKKNDKMYHHILNPETGLPVNNDLLSVTVISDKGTYADSLATALFVMGYEKGLKYAERNDIHAVFVLKDNSVKFSSTLKYNTQNQIVIG